MTIDLVAIDLDGTLLGSNNTISKRNRAAVVALQEKGVAVTLATGRMFASANRIAEDLGISCPLICYQGAQIREPSTGHILSETVLPQPLCRRVIQFALQKGLHVNAFSGDSVFMSALTDEGKQYLEVSRVEATIVGNLLSWLTTDLLKIVLVTKEEETLSVVTELQELFGEELTATRSHPLFAETISARASKGNALKWLSGHLQIPLSNIMGIGDNLNDLSLVSTAGFGVAMGNAAPEVKEQASHITGIADEDGVAQSIETFAL